MEGSLPFLQFYDWKWREGPCLIIFWDDFYFKKDQNEVLLNEQSRIEDELTESKAEIVRLEEVYTIVKQFYQESSLENSTLEECRELFITLREKYSVEYTLYGLDAIAIPVLLPKVVFYFYLKHWTYECN